MSILYSTNFVPNLLYKNTKTNNLKLKSQNYIKKRHSHGNMHVFACLALSYVNLFMGVLEDLILKSQN